MAMRVNQVENEDFPSNLCQVDEGFLEALLNDVFRVLVISCYSERDSEDARFVPHKEFIKAICIPRFGTSHKPRFIA
jgi:hypothetical protein